MTICSASSSQNSTRPQKQNTTKQVFCWFKKVFVLPNVFVWKWISLRNAVLSAACVPGNSLRWCNYPHMPLRNTSLVHTHILTVRWLNTRCLIVYFFILESREWAQSSETKLKIAIMCFYSNVGLSWISFKVVSGNNSIIWLSQIYWYWCIYPLNPL